MLKILKKNRTKKIETSVKPLADVCGEEYEKKSTAAFESVKALEKLKTDIKEYAAKDGEDRGKERILEGKNFEVGYCNVEGSAKFNEKRAKKLLKPAIWAQCLMPQVDEAKVEQLIATKKIDRAMALKLFDFAPAQKRIVVRRKKKKI